VRIKITSGKVSMEAELNGSDTAKALAGALPVEGKVNTWGDEIYFSVPVDSPPENPVETVEEGDIAYWPRGNAFCIFFGMTPVSSPGEIRPASAVNPLGKLLGDPGEWKKVSDGDDIRLEP